MLHVYQCRQCHLIRFDIAFFARNVVPCSLHCLYGSGMSLCMGTFATFPSCPHLTCYCRLKCQSFYDNLCKALHSSLDQTQFSSVQTLLKEHKNRLEGDALLKKSEEQDQDQEMVVEVVEQERQKKRQRFKRRLLTTC